MPLTYEVLSGNTSDKTTLADFLESIEAQYGQADRVWVMDRGIPTEETLQAMRTSGQPIYYLVGTPKGKLTQLEQAFLTQPWQQIRDEVQVRVLPREGELYVLARSDGRVHKERAMRSRSEKTVAASSRTRDRRRSPAIPCCLKWRGKKEASRVYALVDISLRNRENRSTRRPLPSDCVKKNCGRCAGEKDVICYAPI